MGIFQIFYHLNFKNYFTHLKYPQFGPIGGSPIEVSPIGGSPIGVSPIDPSVQTGVVQLGVVQLGSVQMGVDLFMLNWVPFLGYPEF